MAQNKDLMTLKDLPKINDWFVAREDLRQEAINWINACEHPEDFSTHNRCGFYYDEKKKHKKPIAVFCCCCQRTMEMNNITKEDLQDDTKE